MKMPLPENGHVPLGPGELADLAAQAKAARDTMQAAHDKFTREADRIRGEVAGRYNSEVFRNLTGAERRRIAEQETTARVSEARSTALVSMDAVAQKQISPIMAAASISKPFYRSAALTIGRSTLDSERRARITANLAQGGPTELWQAAVTALQRADLDMVAAVIQATSALPLEERPFGPGEFAARFAFAPHENAVAALGPVDKAYP